MAIPKQVRIYVPTSCWGKAVAWAAATSQPIGKAVEEAAILLCDMEAVGLWDDAVVLARASDDETKATAVRYSPAVAERIREVARRRGITISEFASTSIDTLTAGLDMDAYEILAASAESRRRSLEHKVKVARRL